MQKVWLTLAALLCLGFAAVAQAQAIPSEIGFRYNADLSNGPAGKCGCFTMQGGAADLNWDLMNARSEKKRSFALGLAADFGVEHTGNVNGNGYGLTLSTFDVGPRLRFPGNRVRTFAQALIGVAHGSGSQFPQGNNLVASATSNLLDLGAGADIPLNKRFSLRVLQVDYLRTTLPNNSTNWQNNLHIGAGLTLHFSH